MEETMFIKKFINLLRYDKPYNSMPFVLLLILTFVGLGNVYMTAIEEPDVDISVDGIKVAMAMSVLVMFRVGQSINPESSLELVQLIEDDFVVNRKDFYRGNDEKWIDVDELHAKKKKNLKLKFRYLANSLTLACIVFSLRNAILNYLQGIETSSDDSGRLVTPYLAICPPEFERTIFFLYVLIIHILIMLVAFTQGYMLFSLVCVSTEKLLVDLETLYLLLGNLSRDFPDSRVTDDGQCDSESILQRKRSSIHYEDNLRRVMAVIVKCHQNINRKFKSCADNSSLMVAVLITIIVSDATSNVFFMIKAKDMKSLPFAVQFIVGNQTLFYIYYNGQRIFNQNDILRRYLSELPWTDKPNWFKKTVHIMMTRANVDTEMRPFGILILNYSSFKDLMKFTFTFGNLLYTINQSS